MTTADGSTSTTTQAHANPIFKNTRHRRNIYSIMIDILRSTSTATTRLGKQYGETNVLEIETREK